MVKLIANLSLFVNAYRCKFSFLRTDFNNSMGIVCRLPIVSLLLVVTAAVETGDASVTGATEFGVCGRTGDVDVGAAMLSAWAIGCNEPFFSKKHVTSGFVVPGDIDVLELNLERKLFRMRVDNDKENTLTMGLVKR